MHARQHPHRRLRIKKANPTADGESPVREEQGKLVASADTDYTISAPTDGSATTAADPSATSNTNMPTNTSGGTDGAVTQTTRSAEEVPLPANSADDEWDSDLDEQQYITIDDILETFEFLCASSGIITCGFKMWDEDRTLTSICRTIQATGMRQHVPEESDAPTDTQWIVPMGSTTHTMSEEIALVTRGREPGQRRLDQCRIRRESSWQRRY